MGEGRSGSASSIGGVAEGVEQQGYVVVLCPVLHLEEHHRLGIEGLHLLLVEVGPDVEGEAVDAGLQGLVRRGEPADPAVTVGDVVAHFAVALQGALIEDHQDPDRWRTILSRIEAANREGARMMPQVLAIATVTFPPEERGQSFSLFGFSAGFAAVCGPILGGLLIGADIGGLDWRPIFRTEFSQPPST